MPQGANLPTLHTWNIQSTLYVDGVNGNDSTGNGSTGAPWATLQKAHDVLEATHTWPGSGDQCVRIRDGTYQASAADYTLDTSFNSAGQAPSATRFLIWANDSGATPIIENPTGSSGPRGAVRVGNNVLNGHQIFSGIEFYGGDTRRGAAGNGNSLAIYFSGGPDCEVIDCIVHGFQAASGSPSTAQGITCEGNADGLKIVRTKIYDIGTTTLTTNQQEHGIYMQRTNALFLNLDIYNIVNGYEIQFYNSNANTFGGAIVAHCTLDGAECSAMNIHGDASDITFVNNIFSNHTGRGGSSYAIEFFPNGSGLGSGSVVDHNVYYNNTGGNRDQSPTGWSFTNEGSGNPLYTSSTNHHLQVGSPAIGFADTNYSPTTDIEGTARPASGEDAGAYERAPLSAFTLVAAAGAYALTGATTTTRHDWRIVAQTLP